jgi:inorganic pyrophosphatase
MSNSRRFLGQTVTVEIDRPLGSAHPKHPHIIYPVNYGFIPGTVSGDGEPLDAYILGIDEELAEFTGVVHAIIHRLDEDDDKLIVAPEELELTDDDIIEATHFQEQYFESEIWRTES